MIQIRPVSDLRNKFSEIEKIVSSGQPVFLTKNGYGTMVVMDLERFTGLSDYTDYVESKLAEAVDLAKNTDEWLTAEQVFGDYLGETDDELHT